MDDSLDELTKLRRNGDCALGGTNLDGDPRKPVFLRLEDRESGRVEIVWIKRSPV